MRNLPALLHIRLRITVHVTRTTAWIAVVLMVVEPISVAVWVKVPECPKDCAVCHLDREPYDRFWEPANTVIMRKISGRCEQRE
jgi:hypothetical protein